jgi:uncharacterized RDD family membrane protein YckC
VTLPRPSGCALKPVVRLNGVVDRRDVGSWLQGPDAVSEREWSYPGERLGRPDSGTGSLARPGRRFLSLLIDWALCLLIARGIFGVPLEHGGQLVAIGVLVVENVLLVGTTGTTLGQRIMGVRVERMDGGRVGLGKVVIRSVLLGLGIPPLTLIWEPDGRGLHDLLSGSVVARR